MNKILIGFITGSFFLLQSCTSELTNENEASITEETQADKVGVFEGDTENLEEVSVEINLEKYSKDLNGIEKFYVQKGIRELHSLLKYKKDERYLELEKEMSNDDIMFPLLITVLDAKNGYIKYAPMGAEVSYTMVYWNKSNGEKLIATTEIGCGPICDCSISFTLFNEKTNTYSTIAPDKIIKDYDALRSNFDIPIENEDDPHEFMFILPQKGKNITYCIHLDSECIDLVWNDGSFSIK